MANSAGILRQVLTLQSESGFKIMHVLLTRPMGVFERELFSGGTRALMKSVADLTNRGVTTVIGRCTCSFNYRVC